MVREKGMVAKWLNHKGMGFIAPEKGGDDILVFFTEVQQNTQDGFKSLMEGCPVEYDTKPDPKNEGKVVAINVTGPNGSNPEPRQKGKGGKFGKGKGFKGFGKGLPKGYEKGWEAQKGGYIMTASPWELGYVKGDMGTAAAMAAYGKGGAAMGYGPPAQFGYPQAPNPYSNDPYGGAAVAGAAAYGTAAWY